MIGFLGVSRATLYTFNNTRTPYTQQTASSWYNKISVWVDWMTLYSINVWNCVNCALTFNSWYTISSNTGIVLQTGWITSPTGYDASPTIVNFPMQKWVVYRIWLSNDWVSFQTVSNANQMVTPYTSWFFAFHMSIVSATPYLQWNRDSAFQDFVFSWTLPTTPTIRYNWTSWSFAGSNIYLYGNYTFSLSGTDYLFNAQTYRVRLPHF
jgi:hypothetical protein